MVGSVDLIRIAGEGLPHLQSLTACHCSWPRMMTPIGVEGAALWRSPQSKYHVLCRKGRVWELRGRWVHHHLHTADSGWDSPQNAEFIVWMSCWGASLAMQRVLDNTCWVETQQGLVVQISFGKKKSRGHRVFQPLKDHSRYPAWETLFLDVGKESPTNCWMSDSGETAMAFILAMKRWARCLPWTAEGILAVQSTCVLWIWRKLKTRFFGAFCGRWWRVKWYRPLPWIKHVVIILQKQLSLSKAQAWVLFVCSTFYQGQLQYYIRHWKVHMIRHLFKQRFRTAQKRSSESWLDRWLGVCSCVTKSKKMLAQMSDFSYFTFADNCSFLLTNHTHCVIYIHNYMYVYLF